MKNTFDALPYPSMQIIADLHIHSKYARACSPQLTLENIDLWARIKGLHLMATGDFTHPKWFPELQEKLEPSLDGLYRLKPEYRVKDARFTEKSDEEVHFVCGTELSCIYSHGGKVRRVHHTVFAPSIEAVAGINAALIKRGGKLGGDGRPILGISSKDLLLLIREVDPRCHIIPAHAWTPWFAIFGSKSGYDSIEECFEELAPEIFAIETGLSSDPAMNWRVKSLDKVALISSSDAHSLPNLGREATVFEGEELSYNNIFTAIRNASPEARKKPAKEKLTLRKTLEFFPDEGRYHYDGHRDHKVCLSPAESRKLKGICPKCGRPLTIGVLNRVEELTTEAEGRRPENVPDFLSLVELDKVIAQALGVRGRATKKVEALYWPLVSQGGGELKVLSEVPIEQLKKMTETPIVEAIQRLREGKVEVEPGYDGEYGHIILLSDSDRKRLSQSSLF